MRMQTASTMTQFVWDEENLIEARPNGSLTTRYTLPPGVWDDLISENISGTSTFFGFDMSGNTNQLTNSSNDPQSTTGPYLYKAFGEQFSAPTAPPPFLFGGMVGYYTDLTALLYVRARFFAPNKGRWESRDPIGFDGVEWNLYGYTKNNPIVHNDPTGLATDGHATTYTGTGCMACTGGGTTSYLCRRHCSIPPEQCYFKVCASGSEMIGARWNGDPRSSSVAEYAGSCMAVVQVSLLDSATKTRVLKTIHVLIADTGRLCSHTDPGCKLAYKANQKVWPGHKRVIDLLPNAWSSLVGSSTGGVVPVRISASTDSAYSYYSKICYSSIEISANTVTVCQRTNANKRNEKNNTA